jgi:hypothetical protein
MLDPSAMTPGAIEGHKRCRKTRIVIKANELKKAITMHVRDGEYKQDAMDLVDEVVRKAGKQIEQET